VRGYTQPHPRRRRLGGNSTATHNCDSLNVDCVKCRRMIFGRKNEKLAGQLEQLEFRLEELEIARRQSRLNTLNYAPEGKSTRLPFIQHLAGCAPHHLSLRYAFNFIDGTVILVDSKSPSVTLPSLLIWMSARPRISCSSKKFDWAVSGETPSPNDR
jgi:hypothetical protein